MTLVDADVRERLRTEPHRTFFVEAGAGTGKTSIIVARIVHLVAEGWLTMEGLAAITFTEAAAAELRDRVRQGLEEAAADLTRDAAARAHCEQAVEDVDLAAIQTIHAFAGSLLRAYPLEANLPPGFTTLDAIEQGLAFEERFRAWFWTTALEPAAREVLRRALLLGLRQSQLHELAWALEGQHDLLTPSTTWDADAPPDAVAAAHAIGTDLAALASLTAYAHNASEDPLAAHVLRLQAGAERLQAAATEDAALAALCGLGSVKFTKGRQADWDRLPDGRNACAAIKEALDAAQGEVAAILAGHRTATFAGVLALLRDLVLAGVAARRDDGVATFQDLLAWARDLLRDHPEVRQRAQARYTRLFVDEFQDTDPLQAEIAFYLAADPAAPPSADWQALPLVPGKLFVVGDPKQSIYRFRRADIAVYDALQQRLAEAVERLQQNFRSVDPVIAWVNHHFAAHIEAQAGVQPTYVALAPHRAAFANGVTCGVHRVGGPSEGKAADVARAEAAALARLAHHAVATWHVADETSSAPGATRPAQYRDLCILLPSRTHLRTLERALEATDVPYRVESGALLLDTQEVRDLLAGLRAIEDPSDQVALVATLRSPAFGCSDPDILRWVEGGGRLSHEAPGPGPDGPVRAALACLAELHTRRHHLSPPALIEAYCRERLLVVAAFGEPRPREAWRRLRYVVGRAREFTATGRHTLRAFLDWIDGLARAQVRDAESAEAEPDEDAVRILTVHGAKGLEFPIVALAGLGAARRGSSTGVEVIPDRRTGALACRAGDWQTAEFTDAAARERATAAAEDVRLLYVAGTRARDHLVLSLHRSVGKESSAAALIEAGLASWPESCSILSLEERTSPPPTARPEEETADGWGNPAEEQAWVAARQARVRRLSAPPAVVAPGAARDGLWGLDHRPLVDQAAGLDGEVGAEMVRALLRRARGSTLPLAPAVPPAVLAQAQTVMGSDAYQRAQASTHCRRDVPLLATVDGVLLDQVADLVYETPTGYTLVLYDFGAEETTAPESTATMSRREWAGVLALAFQTATGQHPIAVEVIDAGGDGATTRFDDGAALSAEARGALSEPSTPGSRSTEGWRPATLSN